MATPEQQQSPATALPMLVKKLNSSPSMMSHPLFIISGDMNAQIGKSGNHKFSRHNSSNKNGQQLTYFTIENRLTCLNTNFQKREGKLWTYTYSNNTKAQRDYVFINKKWNNSALNCVKLTPHSRVYPPITELSRQKYD